MSYQPVRENEMAEDPGFDMGPIRLQIVKNAEALDNLGNQILKLSRKLDPITNGATHITGIHEERGDKELQSEVTQKLRDHFLAIQNLIERVSTLLETVEL